jgi:aldehyde dehydrogenase (NAD+)
MIGAEMIHDADIRSATGEDVDLAVKSARRAFQTSWGKQISGTERGRLILALADLMERDQQVLAELESLDTGKPIRLARQVPLILIALRVLIIP